MKNFQSCRLVQQTRYKSFQPTPINREWAKGDMRLIQLLGQADRELGRQDMYSEYIPNIDLFIRMRVLKEVTQSSKIEVAGVSPASAYKLIADLELFVILKEINGGKRSKIYVFDAYLKLFK